MENVNVKIRNISLKSYRCFEEVTLNCAKDDNSVYQWTVLLGNNNTGKTSLLKAIANLRPVSFKGITPSNTQDVSSDTTLYRAVSAAIVLVDEIDLHLHPMWQRDNISFLSRSFPNIQFIVTTHSPLVIQSMNEVNLSVLHRQDDKVALPIFFMNCLHIRN